MCDHSEDKGCTLIKGFGGGTNIYMCECGALIDIGQPRNFSSKVNSMMTPDELEYELKLIRDKIYAEIRRKLE